MLRRALSPLLLAALTAGLLAGPAAAATIRVQSTTDTIDAGLVDGLLKPAYAAAQPGDTLQYVGVGTGKALDNAKAGLADVVITHAPSLEQQFVEQGYSLEPYGRAIFFSDYVLVGPTGDPAHVADVAPHDAIGALEAIAAAGGNAAANFVSRGDNSGTNVQEQLMWGLTAAPLVKQPSANGGGDAARFEPGTGGTLPAWYHRTNKGQAANLQDAAVCNADTYPGGGCYTMVDRGTFNRVAGQGLISNLKIVSQGNDAGARGGADLLVNPFHAYVVNPAKVTEPPVDVTAGLRLLDFLTSPGFQAAVSGFPSADDPAFRPDAFPAVTVSTPPPASAKVGDAITLAVNLDNRLPGAGPVDGIPVQLQRSLDGGSSWQDDGAPVPSDAAGHVVLTSVVTSITGAHYRVATPRYRDLSPTSADLGAVTVARSQTPQPVPDRTKPRLSKPGLARRAVTVTIDEAATLRAIVARKVTKKVRRGGKTRTVTSYETVKTVSGKAKQAGKVRLAWKHAVPRGTYRLTLRATDRAGNVRSLLVRLRAK